MTEPTEAPAPVSPPPDPCAPAPDTVPDTAPRRLVRVLMPRPQWALGREGRLWLVLAFVTGAATAVALVAHERAEALRAEVLPTERQALEVRTLAETQARLLDEVRPKAEAWTRTMGETLFTPVDRETLVASVLSLAEDRRIGRLDWSLEPPRHDQPAPGLTRDSVTLSLTGDALIDGDALSFVESLLTRWAGRLVLRTLNVERIAPDPGDEATLALVRAGEPVGLVRFAARLDLLTLAWDAKPPPPLGADDGTGPVLALPDDAPPPEALLIDTPQTTRALVRAITEGPWGRPPGWRDLRDVTLTNLMWAGPSRWRLWLNDQPLGPEDPVLPHVRVLRVTPGTATLAVSRGPRENAVVVLRPGQTYRVHQDRLDDPGSRH